MGWRSDLGLGVLAAALCAGCNNNDLTPLQKAETAIPTPSLPPEQQAPVAVIQGDSFYTPGETAVFNGSHSYDPDGTIVSFDWSIEAAPAGSAPTLNTNADFSNFDVEVVGDYTVRLTVTDDDGNSAQAEVSFGVALGQGLRVELAWPETFGQVDLDAHLLDQSAGGGFENLANDCFWYNCVPASVGATPDWGGAGNADDPGLDGDNINQFVPENIVIDDPADGTYRYLVHYYPRPGPDLASTMTVKIFAGGVEIWTMNKTLAKDRDLWTAADIVWSGTTATVQLIDTVDENVQ